MKSHSGERWRGSTARVANARVLDIAGGGITCGLKSTPMNSLEGADGVAHAWPAGGDDDDTNDGAALSV
jgi:hypothetical protein